MSGLRLCVNTQTPPVRFKANVAELGERYEGLARPLDIADLQDGVDYDLAVGGVPVMIRSLLRRGVEEGWIDAARWVSLNPAGPAQYRFGRIVCDSIALPSDVLASYAACKESLWRQIHGLPDGSITTDTFSAFSHYNCSHAARLLALASETDVFYVHDFQQAQVGHLVGLAAPTVFRWHIPFRPETMPLRVSRFLVRCLEGFDSIIVSCRRDLEGLIRAGYRGHAHQCYPYFNEERWPRPSDKMVEQVSATFALGDDDDVVLVPGRMDPIKGQDTMLRAMPRLLKRHPRVKLVLAGNGSFTSSAGGLGRSKGALWRAELERLARELKVSDRVVFTGHVAEDSLAPLIARSSVVVQPSLVEGFGLTAVEAWSFGRPVVVGSGAGVSELVNSGVNGYTFPSGDDAALAEAVGALLDAPEEAARMGARGKESATRCHLDEGTKRVREILEAAAGGARSPSPFALEEEIRP